MLEATSTKSRKPSSVDIAIQKAMRDAVVSHALAGRAVAVWRDGQVMWIQPDEVLRGFPGTSQSEDPMKDPTSAQ